MSAYNEHMPKTNPRPKTTPEKIKPDLVLRELHSREGQFADIITFFAGSMAFVYVHVIWFGFWIMANQGFFLPIIPIFDPYPYGLLTMIVSLEAIFLATFIMISQNRQALIDTYREYEEQQEQKEEEQEQAELEEEVEDIQQDLDDIKSAMQFIQTKLDAVEKTKFKSHPPKEPTQS